MTGDDLRLGCPVSYSNRNPKIQGRLDLLMLASGGSSCMARSVRRPLATYAFRLRCRNVGPRLINVSI